MKNLKENIHKNNMKKLMLSVVLGMFCYCTNNAAEYHENNINGILIRMLVDQNTILRSKAEIKNLKGKIYATIKDGKGKVTKKNVLDFIKERIPKSGQNEKKIKNDINKIEQYFHLDEIKKDDEECNEGNLTEIFWSKEKEGEKKEEWGKKEKEDEKDIENYDIHIISAEEKISKDFKEYYEAKKEEKRKEENVENVEDDIIIEEIIQKCCEKEEGMDITTKFFENLKKKVRIDDFLKESEDAILATIKKRITLKNK